MNEQQPLVSVLMTAYNRQQYIAEAIESVLASTYKNFELIIVDDCSTDNTVAIAKSYEAKDSRVKVYANEKNLGDYPNRNKAASYAKGKYLKYVDADDLIYPNGLEVLVTMMERFPEAGWGLCSLEQDENKIFPFLLNNEGAYQYNYFGPGLFHKAPLSSIIKKNAFVSIGGFSGKQHLGDFELWHLLALKFPVLLMPQGIVWHRSHDEQESSHNRVNPAIPFKYKVAALHFFQSCNLIPLNINKKNLVITKIKKSMNRLILKKYLKGQFAIALSLRKIRDSHAYDFKKLD